MPMGLFFGFAFPYVGCAARLKGDGAYAEFNSDGSDEH